MKYIVVIILFIVITVQVYISHLSFQMIASDTAIWWDAVMAASKTAMTWFMIIMFTSFVNYGINKENNHD